MITADVLLLDMGGTFMFDCDRFSSAEDLYGSYTGIGGSVLTRHDLHATIQQLIDHMGRLANDVASQDDFPSIREALAACEGVKEVSSVERDLVAQVVENHEVGVIPQRYRDILGRLANHYRLGVISNVWAPSRVFRNAFVDAGISGLFEIAVFSSDHRSVKPSARLFEHAIQQVNVGLERIAFVGNDLRCDVGGAKAIGLKSVWINAEGRRFCAGDPEPDVEVRDLGDLVQQ